LIYNELAHNDIKETMLMTFKKYLKRDLGVEAVSEVCVGATTKAGLIKGGGAGNTCGDFSKDGIDTESMAVVGVSS
jgi:hypothetical protein